MVLPKKEDTETHVLNPWTFGPKFHVCKGRLNPDTYQLSCEKISKFLSGHVQHDYYISEMEDKTLIMVYDGDVLDFVVF